MRGERRLCGGERHQLKLALMDMCEDDVVFVDLSMTHLNLANCDELLGQLGYVRDKFEVLSDECDIWVQYIHPKLPTLEVVACGYTAGLGISFEEDADVSREDKELLIRMMKNVWGRYYPVW